MLDYGMIEVHETQDPRGRIIRNDYKWIGDDITYISIQILEDLGHTRIGIFEGDIIDIGPFKVKVIEIEPWADRVKAIRVNNPLSYIRYYWHRFSRLADLAYRRFIICLAVFNLADYNPATIPHWSDIHFIKKLHRRFTGNAESK